MKDSKAPSGNGEFMNMKKIVISLDKQVKGKVRIGVLQFVHLKCVRHHPELWEAIYSLEKDYRERYGQPSDALELLKPARRLYHNFGMEPTRYRPSSEALFRRVIKQKSLYRINSIVDVCNYCSLKFLLPIGLYDTDKIQGQVSLRLGGVGEEYDGIGKETIHVAGRLALTDEQGAFGNPSADSLRTSIDLKSRNVLMVIFAPGEYPETEMKNHCQFAHQSMLQFHPEGDLIDESVVS